jgi:hypothetical protein
MVPLANLSIGSLAPYFSGSSILESLMQSRAVKVSAFVEYFYCREL